MLSLVIGTKQKPVQSDALLAEVQTLELDEGTLYIGYPILTTPDDKSTIDALLIAPKTGVVIFDLLDSAPEPNDYDSFWEERADHQNHLALGVSAKLMVHKALTQRRALGFEINVVTFAPAGTRAPPEEHGLLLATEGTLGHVLETLPALPPQYLAPLNAAIERVSNIKPRNKRAGVSRVDSRGAIIKAIEKEIANLDQWQKKGAIESPDGPQRIRGLAGSGKTVVLALKAAYLHAQHPEWTIGVTFWTRSLYEQFQDFIRRFSFEHSNDEPDWSRLRIMHGWGTPREPGVYSVIASAHGLPVRDFSYAKSSYGRRDAFQGVCREVLQAASQSNVAPIFDALIVDEAQDFPPEFFEMVYGHLGEPKRLIWAYDELQNLNETTMPPLSKLFGVDDRGEPRVKLRNDPGKPHQDIILPVCYRNPPWTLAIAHALGFGVYRDSEQPPNLVQMFDDARLWQDIGYRVVSGTLQPQHDVSLERRPEASPEFFTKLLKPEDAFIARQFESDEEQTKTVADEIATNVREDELEPSDILVVFPNPITVPDDAGPLVVALRERGVEAHIAGVTTRRDQFFLEGSVTISGIYRAKGNEAPMVYLLGAEHCARGPELLRKRNTVFTALTRSRAWVRISGVGPRMGPILDEINAIRAKQYRLEFRVPTQEELAKLRSIHRDRTETEKQRVEAAAGAFKNLVEDLQAGVVSIDDLSPADRKKLASILLKSK